MSKFYYFVLLLVASSLVNAQQDDGVTEEIVVSSVGQKTANEITFLWHYNSESKPPIKDSYSSSENVVTST